MNVFDIIGPIMIGPSSSHTAGAVRIGLMVRSLLEEEPVEARIIFHGSFAETYKGHGTDKAIIGGLLGFAPDDTRIRDSLKIGLEKGLKYTFETANLGDTHPNSALIQAKGRSGRTTEMLGASVGGGNISILKIDDVSVKFSGEYNTLIIPHQDMPGLIASVAEILAKHNINIAQMAVYRAKKGGLSMMIIETDQMVTKEVHDQIKELQYISSVKVIKPV